ncbi:FAD-binding oxidoreductase [Streptomyces tuirus]|uniref:FAD-binding oxidoreductase n=1 Tax=Streptomyces tuirus TaxID=68278 RepID=A0A941FB25_9ACTN|nr:FAD-binding oxidoreductase [Streptomyces tuirus]
MTSLGVVSGALDKLSELAAELEGSICLPGSPEYEQEIAPYNVAVRHSPQLVVCAAGVRDVQAVLRYAAAQGLPVGVQATGHGALEPVDRGILLSTRQLGKLAIDPAARTATLGAGVRWRDVLAAAAPYGLATLSGSNTGVGAVGYTLGGGIPVMGRTFGFAADWVRSFEVVTPDAHVLHVDPKSEPELFWALCGGAGNFGVVTEMTIELVEVSTVYGGAIYYTGEHLEPVLRAYRSWAETLPEHTNSSVAMIYLPPPLQGTTLVHIRFCHVGDPAEGERLIAPMREVAPALLDEVRVMPYTEVDTIHRDPENPVPFYPRGALLTSFTDETVDALLEVVGPEHRIPMVFWELRPFDAAFRRTPTVENCVGGRDAAYFISLVGLATPGLIDFTKAGIQQALAALAPWSKRETVVNLHGSLGDEADRSRAWDEATYERLAGLKRQLDPASTLRYGHIIGLNAQRAG